MKSNVHNDKDNESRAPTVSTSGTREFTPKSANNSKIKHGSSSTRRKTGGTTTLKKEVISSGRK